jgi:branched-chain amino acid transport system substrate-binding protein
MLRKITLVAITVLALALTACGAAAPATITCTDKIGCITIGANDPIHIAYMLVTSGPDGSLGIDSRRGIEIAVDDKKTIAGHAIKLDGQDDLCSADGGQAAGTKLAADKTIVAVIGGSCSSATRAALPALSQAGLLVVSPSATAPSLTAPDTRVAGFFRSCYNDQVQGKLAAEFAFNELKVKVAATIHDGSPYAQQLQQVFADNFKKLGGTITEQAAIKPDDTNLKPTLTRLATGKPQLIYYPIFVAAGGFATSQAKEVSGLEKTILMAADGTFAPDFIKAAGKASEGMYMSSPDITNLGKAYDEFVAKHKKKYNEAPVSAYHPHSYDALNMVAAAIEKVAKKNSDNSLLIGRQELRDAFAATKDFQGLTGKLTCDANGDCGANIVAVYKVESSDPKNWPPKKVYPK